VELRQLRYFAEVAAVGSFSGAAKNLSMAQPSLWRAVKTLESELGFQLFESSPRGVRLTRAGATMLGRTKQLLEVADGLAQLSQELRRGKDGLVVVGCTAPQVPTLIAPLIGALHRSHPGIHVALRNTDATPDVAGLLSSEDDIDFVTSSAKLEDGLGRYFLAHAHVVVVTPQDHPWRNRSGVEMEELVGVPVILSAPHTLSRQLIARHLAECGITFDVVLESDNLETAVAMAEAGIGIALIGHHERDGAAQPWPHLTHDAQSVSTPIWLYWLKERPLQNPPAQRLIEILHDARKTKPTT
jgi:DNA-binding transcriptional LysR family regulator